ncbi:MAG: hypothetical protein JSS81_21675 [Acidobacteria bacterium]|nr:hypothetical protein [Acidobacteriota bacterium]
MNDDEGRQFQTGLEIDFFGGSSGCRSGKTNRRRDKCAVGFRNASAGRRTRQKETIGRRFDAGLFRCF